MVSVASVSCTGSAQSGKNVWKIKFFQAREKSGKFCLSQGNWQKLEIVREKSGNFKILSKLKCQWQSSYIISRIIFIFCKMIFKFSEFLYIPDCLTRMLYVKFQAVFEEKTEGCANCHTDQNQLPQKNSCMLVG